MQGRSVCFCLFTTNMKPSQQYAVHLNIFPFPALDILTSDSPLT